MHKSPKERPLHIKMTNISVKRITIDDGISVFYRTASPPHLADASTVLLLHGYPSSSHQYRHLIPLLAKQYNVIAPDFPGFGFTEVPPSRDYEYTFASLTTTLAAFLDALNHLLRGVHIQLRRARSSASRVAAPRGDHRHHLAKRECLRGGAGAVVGSDQGVLGVKRRGRARGRAQECADCRDDEVEVHPRVALPRRD